MPTEFHNGFLDVVEEFVGVWGLVLGLPIGSIVAMGPMGIYRISE